MVWDDLDYEPERFLPDGNTRETADPVAVNLDLLETYKRLIGLRQQYPALSLGDFQTLLTDDQQQIYAYSRSLAGQTVIVALNNTRQAQTVELEVSAAGTVTDVLNDNAQYPVEDGKIRVSLAPLWGAILLKDE